MDRERLLRGGRSPVDVHVTRTNRSPGRTCALVGAGVQLAIAIAFGVIRETNASVGERHVEGPLPTLALAAVVAAPGVLALVGVLIDRPVLFGAAAAACLPLAIISIAALPALLPAGLLLVAFIQATSVRPPAPAPTLVIFAAFIGLVVVALGIILSGKGTYIFTYPDGGQEGGDYYLPGPSAVALAIVTGAVGLVTALAAWFAKR